MATTLTDTIYSGLAHTQPPTVPPAQAKVIESCWLEWLPWATMHARRHSDPASYLYALKTTHHSRVVALLSAGIHWDVIRRHRLDDPLVGRELFEFQLQAALKRKQERIGRVKGIKRKRV